MKREAKALPSMADHCNRPPSPCRSFSGNNKPTNQRSFNPIRPKLQNAKGGSKNFMAPTVSAAAKFTPSPKEKVSMERNDTFSHRKAATFSSSKIENFPDSVNNKTVPTGEEFVGSNGKKMRRSLSGLIGFSVILVLLVAFAPSFVEFLSLYEQSRAVAESSRLSLGGSSVFPVVEGDKRAPLQFTDLTHLRENAWNESYHSEQGVENVEEDDELDSEIEEEAYADKSFLQGAESVEEDELDSEAYADEEAAANSQTQSQETDEVEAAVETKKSRGNDSIATEQTSYNTEVGESFVTMVTSCFIAGVVGVFREFLVMSHI